jgi:outer membrane cobalamin receptor
MSVRYVLFLLICIFSLGATAADLIDLGELPVTAALDREDTAPLNQTIMGKRRLHIFEQPSFAAVLVRMPGVVVTPGEGKAGAPQMVYIRGMPHRHSQMIYDGMLLADASALDGSFFSDFLSTDRLTSMKVIRGGHFYQGYNGGLGGSIIVKSDRPENGLDIAAHNELGSKWSSRHYGRVGYGHEKADFLIDAGLRTRSGYRDLQDHHKFFNPENLRTPSYGLKTGLYPHERLDINIQHNRTYASTNLMNETGRSFDHLNQNIELDQARVKYRALSEQNWQHSLMVYRASHNRVYKFPGNARYKSQNTSFKYDSVYKTGATSLYYGGARLHERAENLASRRKNSLYGLIKHKLGSGITLRGGAINQKTSRFESNFSYSGMASLKTPKWGNKIFVSIAKAAKEPSFFYLYDPRSGNRDLGLEKNLSWDMGVEQAMGSQVLVRAAYFQNNLRDAINFSFNTWRYNQIDHLKSHGLESELQYNFSESLILRGTYTLSLVDQNLLTLPKHNGTIEATYDITDKVRASALLHYQSAIKSPFKNLKNHYTTDVIVKYQPHNHLEMYVRSDNILNRKYRGWLGCIDSSRRIYIGMKI